MTPADSDDDISGFQIPRQPIRPGLPHAAIGRIRAFWHEKLRMGRLGRGDVVHRIMYIAMNEFRVYPERGQDFERAWRERESYLDDVPGLEQFHLLEGPTENGAKLYASHTVWKDEASFRHWIASDAFRKAHSQGNRLSGILLGPPTFTGWNAVSMAG